MIRIFERDEDFREEELVRAAALVWHSMEKTLPAPEDCTHVFSPKFERKMGDVMVLERRNSRRSVLRWAVMVLICLTLGLGVLATLDTDAQAELFSWKRSYEEVSVTEGSVGVDILRYRDRLAHLTAENTITDIQTGEKLCDIPQSWIDRFPWINAVTFSPDGFLWLARYEDGAGMLLLRHDPTGSTPDCEMVLEDWKGGLMTGADGLQYASVRKFVVTEDYIYLMCMEDSFGKRLQVYTHDGQLHMDLLTADFEVDADGCFYTISSMTLDTLHKFKTDTKEMLWSVKCRQGDNDWRIYQLAADSTGEELYLLMNEHIYRYSAKTGKQLDVYMNRAGNMLLCETEFVRAMVVDDSGRLHIKSNTVIYRYDPIEGETLARPYTLTVAGPYKDSLIAQAIGLYEKANPGSRIEYRYAYESRSAYEKNIGGLRNQKMADLLAEIEDGEIDLVFATDEVPWLYALDSVDLTEWVVERTKEVELDGALLDAVADENGIFMLPLAVHEYYIEGNRTLMERLDISINDRTTWSEAFALYEKVEGTEYALFSATAKGDVLQWMLRSNADPSTGEIELTDPAVQSALEQLKAVWDKPNFFRNAGMTTATDLAPNVLFCLNGYNENRSIGDQYWDYFRYHEETGEQMELLSMFAGEQQTSRSSGSNHIAMILSEREADAAFDFLSHLTSPSVMGSSLLWQRPINGYVAREELNGAVEDHGSWTSAEIAKAFAEEYTAVCDSVNTIYREDVLPNTKITELIGYLEGKNDLDEVLK